MDPTKSCAQSTSSAIKFSTATPFSLTGIFSALENQIIKMTPILINKGLAKPKKHRPNDPAYDVEGQREAGHLEKYHFVAKIGLSSWNMHCALKDRHIPVILTWSDDLMLKTWWQPTPRSRRSRLSLSVLWWDAFTPAKNPATALQQKLSKQTKQKSFSWLSCQQWLWWQSR